MLGEQFAADGQVGEVSGSQLEVADDPALGEEQMQIVAKDGLLLRAAIAEGGSRDLPLDARLRYVIELHDRDGQAIDDAVRVLGEIERLDHGLPHQIDDHRQVAATAVEARAFGLLWEEIAMLPPATEQDGFLIPPAALAHNCHRNQLGIGTGERGTRSCDARGERCAALLKITDGASAHAVARHGLLQPRDPNTIYAWLAHYLADGLAGLTGHRHGGYRRPPGEEARQELGLAPASPPPSRWSVHTIRASVAALADYSLSGVWRLLQRLHLQRRPLRDHLYSPDPDYLAKVAHLERCLREAVRWQQEVALLFLDEMGYYRWPEGWMVAVPGVSPRALRQAGPTNRQQRLIGALNALTGQADYFDNYLVGRQHVSAFYRRLDQVYAAARRIYVVQDNWSIHHHTDVASTLRQLPRIEPVWLPTYAPWLNPIEQLWRWLRRDALKGRRLADDWPQLRQQGNAFLDQFAHGSPALLRYVGLVGERHLAYVLCSA